MYLTQVMRMQDKPEILFHEDKSIYVLYGIRTIIRSIPKIAFTSFVLGLVLVILFESSLEFLGMTLILSTFVFLFIYTFLTEEELNKMIMEKAVASISMKFPGCKEIPECSSYWIAQKVPQIFYPDSASSLYLELIARKLEQPRGELFITPFVSLCPSDKEIITEIFYKKLLSIFEEKAHENEHVNHEDKYVESLRIFGEQIKSFG
jgi:hypothetical protein